MTRTQSFGHYDLQRAFDEHTGLPWQAHHFAELMDCGHPLRRER